MKYYTVRVDVGYHVWASGAGHTWDWAAIIYIMDDFGLLVPYFPHPYHEQEH